MITDNRIRLESLKNKVMGADEAALLVKKGMVIGISGFTLAGNPKVVPSAIAKRAESGEELALTLITGASVGDEVDGVLTRSGALARRYPYQTNDSLRNAANQGKVAYVDMHLSQVPFYIKQGYFGKLNLAIVEAVAIDEKGNIIPSSSLGCSNVVVEYAEKVIVEINTSQPLELEGIHDVFSPKRIPNTEPIPITSAKDRAGLPYIKCDPAKIAAIVYTDIPDNNRSVPPLDADSIAMAKNLIVFLEKEVAAGRLPEHLPPLQSGVGMVANAILGGLKESRFRDLNVYSEVLQDSVLDLLDSGTVSFACSTALTISPERRVSFYKDFGKYKDKIMLRPMEISNSPEVIRRLGVIAINTALEADLAGNVNSTHVNGCRLMNGIGGSGDFARNASVTIFTTQSTAKNGEISCIVPYVSHIDHTEHDVQIIITEQGYADLRGLTAWERAEKLIENCAHPKFRKELHECVKKLLETMPHKHNIPLGGWK